MIDARRQTAESYIGPRSADHQISDGGSIGFDRVAQSVETSVGVEPSYKQRDVDDGQWSAVSSSEQGKAGELMLSMCVCVCVLFVRRS